MLKRLFDIGVSLVLLVVLAPLMGVIGVGVLVFMGRPVFYVQERPGKGEQLFRMYKFRTMDSDRGIGKLGMFLRASSLDELPQLWHVLVGKMSLVGPRPLLEKYLSCYTDEERERFEVRPGITGLSQISGRNHLSWTQRLALDVEYVRGRSFVGDLVILVKTVFYVLRMKDVVVEPSSQMRDLEDERCG